MIKSSIWKSRDFSLQFDKNRQGKEWEHFALKSHSGPESPMISADKLLLNVIFRDPGATQENRVFPFDFLCKKWLSRRY